MKKISCAVLISAFLFGTGCLSAIIKSAVKDTPVANKIVLHSNPRVGDYALLKGGDEQQSYAKYSIVSKKGSLYVIRIETGVIIPGIGEMGKVTFEMNADRAGNVSSAFLVDGAERTPLKVAAPGDVSYLKPTSLTAAEKSKLEIPSRITVGAGTFNVTPLAYSQVNEGVEQKIVYLMNKSVKFGHVASYVYTIEGDDITKSKALELAEQGRN